MKIENNFLNIIYIYKMNTLLKWCGFKKRKISINRSLNNDDILEKMSFCQKISYWYFHYT